MINLCDYVSPMLYGEELSRALAFVPPYFNMRDYPARDRLVALSTIYKIYYPTNMSVEIYSKLFQSLMRSLERKNDILAIKQRNENFKAIKGGEIHGIIGGVDSTTILGPSGLGKSAAIERAVQVLTQNNLIVVESPFQKIIPVLTVQCPFDSSVKGLLIEICRKVDQILDTNFYKGVATRSTITVDMLIGVVSNIAINHIGVLIIDEIQNVIFSKYGPNLVRLLTQIINSSGISIFMVGTNECAPFLKQEPYLARRSIGVEYQALAHDQHFHEFCKFVFSYQYVKTKTVINGQIINWLFEHSHGISALVISLIHDAQELAILGGEERLDLATLMRANKERLGMVHNYAQERPQTGNNKVPEFVEIPTNEIKEEVNETLFQSASRESKETSREVVDILRKKLTVESVKIP